MHPHTRLMLSPYTVNNWQSTHTRTDTQHNTRNASRIESLKASNGLILCDYNGFRWPAVLCTPCLSFSPPSKLATFPLMPISASLMKIYSGGTVMTFSRVADGLHVSRGITRCHGCLLCNLACPRFWTPQETGRESPGEMSSPPAVSEKHGGHDQMTPTGWFYSIGTPEALREGIETNAGRRATRV